MTSIGGKVAVVTGAASGIGLATALELAQAGAACVVITDIDQEGLEKATRKLEATGTRTQACILDVSDKDAVSALAEDVRERFGGADIVINNAGVAQIAPVEELNYDDFRWVMDINFWGMVYGTKAFLPQLREKGAGHIVNVSSIFGIIAVPTQAAYNSSKFAIRGFTEALRHELGETPINVSCVHPGGIKTRIVANARFLQSTSQTERQEMENSFKKIARNTPEKAARTIVRGIEKNKERILIGMDAKFMDIVQRLLPQKYGRLLLRNGPKGGLMGLSS